MALEIPDEKVLDSLVAVQRELAESGADLKLVERENLHFTVRFLGEISEAEAAEADRRLGGLSVKGTEVEVKGIGAFPNIGRPNVLWVGVANDQEGLVLPIAQSVISALDGIGQHDERPFRAHATLARVRSGRNVQALSAVLRASAYRSFGTIRLSQIKLKASRLTPKGPIYTDLGVYQLA